MARYKWITDDIVFNITNPEDLQDWDQIILTIKSGSNVIEKIKDDTHDDLFVDEEEQVISCSLSQEETALLGKTQLQLNIYYDNFTRGATQIFEIEYSKNLHSEVMPSATE